MAPAKLEDRLERRAVDARGTARKGDRARARPVQGLPHGLNVQLQEGCEAVVEELDLALAEHANEIGGPELP